MTREVYLQRLRRALAGKVSGEELERTVRYYAACLDEAGPEGEEALMAEWGEPEELAERLRAAAGHRRPGRWARAGIAAGLGAVLVLSAVLGLRHLGGSGVRRVETASEDSVAGAFTLEDPFSAVDIEVDVGNVTLIQSGTDYACDLSWSGEDYTLEARVEDGTLVVQGNRSGGIHLTAEDISAWIEITVPEGTDLTGLEAYTGLGDVALTGGENGLSTGHLDVTADMGDVTLSGLRAEETVLTLDMGELSADRCALGRWTGSNAMGGMSFSGVTAEETALTLDMGELTAVDCAWGDTDVDSAGGNVTLTRLEAGTLDCMLDLGGLELTEVTAGPVDLEVAMGGVTAEDCALSEGTVTCDGGDVDLAGALTGTWNAENSMGSVRVSTSAPRESWGWDLSSDLGGVWVDGRAQSTQDHAEGGPNFLTARTDLGEVELNFTNS